MNHELAKTLTTALVQFIDRERPKGTVCCSSYECERLEKAFEVNNFDFVEELTRQKLSGLTEFEDRLVAFALQCNGEFDVAWKEAAKWSKELLALAKKELLSYADESNPAIEAMADLERTFECNPDKLPIWLKDELTKKHLEGYIKGRNDALREMSDFMESHFNCEKARTGTQVATPHMDNYNSQKFVSDEELAASSGTSTLKAEG